MSSWEGMVDHYAISVNMLVRKNKWRLIFAVTDLRKRARHLENELDQKLVAFSKLRVQQEYA
jgi:tRNA splicing endonuclease